MENDCVSDDLYNSEDPTMTAAAEAIHATTLPSDGKGRSGSGLTDTKDLRRLRDKLEELLAITSTEGRLRVGKNHKRTQRRIYNIKAFIDSLPTLLSEMVCCSDDASDYVSDDELIDLHAELDELLAAETALRSHNAMARRFVIEPLETGDVLIRFRGDCGDGGWHSTGAQILSRECFNALAKADPERKRIVNPAVDRWRHRSKRRFRVDTAIVVKSDRLTTLKDGDWRHTGAFECLEASLRNGCFTEIPDVPRVADVATTDEKPLSEVDVKLAFFGIPQCYRVECEIEVEIDADDSLEDAVKYGNWEPNNVQAAIENAIQQGKYCKIEDDESAYFMGVLFPGTAAKNEHTD